MGPDPPGKSQVIWVSIGNWQLDPQEIIHNWTIACFKGWNLYYDN